MWDRVVVGIRAVWCRVQSGGLVEGYLKGIGSDRGRTS